MGDIEFALLELCDQIVGDFFGFLEAGLADFGSVEMLGDAVGIVTLDRRAAFLAHEVEGDVLAFGDQRLRLGLYGLDDVRVEATAQALVGVDYHQKVLVGTGPCDSLGALSPLTSLASDAITPVSRSA